MRPNRADFASVLAYCAALDAWKRDQAQQEKRLLGADAVKALRREVRALDRKHAAERGARCNA